MTVTSFLQRGVRRSSRKDPATHHFAVGQPVRLKSGFGISGSRFSDTYRITATLPAMGNSLQYRIRNDYELHERMATEDSLEPARMSQPGDEATLTERTFGNSQGTATQQSPYQKV